MTVSREGVVIQRVSVPLNDGVLVAGDLFLPDSGKPVPVVVSYYPYRKDDNIGAFLWQPNRYLAAHGYASLLVDFRGLGGSGGIAWEEFDAREGSDGAQIVEWAASQDWCDGNVGVWGMSYGGTTALQIAATQPRHLRAAVAMNGNVDLYHELVYPGGCFSPLERMGTWGASMIAASLLPPTYQDPEGSWYRTWMERLATLPPPMIEPWLDHPQYDEFWRSKVVDVDSIEVPTWIVTGWRDQRPEGMLDCYSRLRGPRRLLVGPWGHWLPDRSPFERVDFLAEMVRWWDTWLRDEPTGLTADPPVSLYVQGQGWRHEEQWPIPSTSLDVLYPSPGGRLTTEATREQGDVPYQADPTVGLTAGAFPIESGVGMPMDQGPDDLRSITFTGSPLDADLEVTGCPEARLRIELLHGDDANVVVKLCDVAPTGSSSLVTSGWLRASHRRSHAERNAIPAGESITLRIQLSATSYLFPRDHRIRLAISCADFPRIFPTAVNPTIRLLLGGDEPTFLRLPVVTSEGAPGRDLPVADPDVDRSPLAIDARPRYSIEHDYATDTVIVTIGGQASVRLAAGDGRLDSDTTARAEVRRARPDAARVIGHSTLQLHTPLGQCVVAEGRTLVTLTGQLLSGRVTLDGEVVAEKTWLD